VNEGRARLTPPGRRWRILSHRRSGGRF